jgi:phage host-nuclease inhibitor protein Gam
MSVTGFNRRRRELAAQQAAKEAARRSENKPLEEMTYQELRTLAKDKGVEDYYKMNKDELREALSVKEGD